MRQWLCHRHRAPHLPASVLTAITLIFAAFTIVRGIGYYTARPGESLSVVTLLALGNVKAWGVAVFIAGMLVIAAYASRRHFLVWLAHGLALITYASVAVAVTDATLEVGSGWQHLAPMLGGVAWHGLLAWLTGPIPPSWTGGTAGDADRP